MNRLVFGTVKDYVDRENSIVLFSAPTIEEAVAYPIFKEKIPEIGQEIFLISISSYCNSYWRYFPISEMDQFTLEHKGNNIIFKDGTIYLQSTNGIVVSKGQLGDGKTVEDPGDKAVSFNKLKDLLTAIITKLGNLNVISEGECPAGLVKTIGKDPEIAGLTVDWFSQLENIYFDGIKFQ